ncbi:hypothetical protein AB0N92_06345 [Streptomyces sp. NPDC093248]|uniref:hypothetical protein n=1 Tax=Streptomyces sp. NPDC093248 TaxID=3155072 RepID=UPI003435E997
MSNEQQRDQQAPQAPAPQTPDPRREFVKRGALTVVGSLVSGAARAVVAHLLMDGE